MATGSKEYVKVPGRGLKRGGASLFFRTRARLWAGRTHLLLVYNYGYSEEYRRFYYRDIQSIIFSKTSRGRNSSIFLAVMTAILVAFLLVSFEYLRLPVVALVFVSFLPAIFLIFLARNLIAGPTCVTVLRTAVSSEELPSLWRVRKAVKAMDLLRPLIEEAQKDLGAAPADAATVEGAGMAKSPAGQNGVPAFTDYDGWAHLVLFGVMIAGGACYAASLLPGLGFTMYPGGLLSLAATFFAIFAVIKQKGSRLEKGLSRTTCVSLTYVFLTYMGLIGFMIFYGIARVISGAGGNADPGTRLFVMNFTNPRLMGFAHTAGWDSLLLMSLYSTAAGIYGLARTLLSRKHYG